MGEPAVAPEPDPPGVTDDRVTLRGARDFAIYYLPASVPFWAAIILGLDFTALTWLIWMEMLPRGLLMLLELPHDKDFQDKPVLPVAAVILGAYLGAMAFVAMFFPAMRETFHLFWLQLKEDGPVTATAALALTWWRMGVVLPLVVATAARAWRAWWIDVRKDPAMAHVRFNTRERRTRRAFGFAAILFWVAGLSRLAALETYGPRFFAGLATLIYCLFPIALELGERIQRKAAALKEPS